MRSQNFIRKTLLVFIVFLNVVSFNITFAYSQTSSNYEVNALYDTYVTEGSPDYSGGGLDQWLRIGDNSGDRYETYLLFTFPSYPTNFTRAFVTLYFTSKFTTQIVSCDIYKLNNITWTETTLTWNTRILDKTKIYAKNIDNTKYYVELDVTNQISGTSLGLSLLVPILLDETCTFCSKENAQPEPQATLTFNYPLPQDVIPSYNLLFMCVIIGISVFLVSKKLKTNKLIIN